MNLIINVLIKKPATEVTAAGSSTSHLHPPIKDSLLLLLLQTCASKPPSPIPSSPPPTRLPRGSRPRREQGALRGERAAPKSRKPSYPLPGQIESSWQRVGPCSGLRAPSSLRSSWASTGTERTHVYPGLPHQDAKPQRPEGDCALKPHLTPTAPS
ncbi:hypothetical protein INR49_022637 [Caranx melampygus]|nr:hypothetical protein INR49_022637 [Caranx melampygus]